MADSLNTPTLPENATRSQLLDLADKIDNCRLRALAIRHATSGALRDCAPRLDDRSAIGLLFVDFEAMFSEVVADFDRLVLQANGAEVRS